MLGWGDFFAVDPLASKYPHYTPYSFSGSKVIHAVELEGLEEREVNGAMGSKVTINGPFKNQEVAQNAANQSSIFYLKSNYENLYPLESLTTTGKNAEGFFTEVNFNNPKTLNGAHIKFSGDISIGSHERDGIRVLGVGTSYEVGLKQEIGSFEILYNGKDRILNLNLYNKDAKLVANGSFLIFKGGLKTSVPSSNLYSGSNTYETDLYNDELVFGIDPSNMKLSGKQLKDLNISISVFEGKKTLFRSQYGTISMATSLSIENVNLEGIGTMMDYTTSRYGSSYLQMRGMVRSRILREAENRKLSMKKKLISNFIIDIIKH